VPKVHCKVCIEKPSFSGMSELRKHQWANHNSMYDNLRKAARSPKARKKQKASMMATIKKKMEEKALAKMPIVKMGSNGASHKHPMTALELFNKLKEQQHFMNQMVAVVGNILESEK